MSSPSPPSSATPTTPDPSPSEENPASFSLPPCPPLSSPQPLQPSSSTSRTSSTQRSRSSSSRSDLQTLLRTGPSSSHLSLTASPSEGGSPSGNPLRRPVDVIPAGTEGLAMPSMNSFLANKDGAKAGLGIGGLGVAGEKTEDSTSYRPQLSGSPKTNMRRTSSASSTSTITNLSRTASNPNFPSSAAPSSYPPPHIGGSGLPSLGGTGLSPGPRAHIRTQGARQAPSSPRPSFSRPASPPKLATPLQSTVASSTSSPPESPNPAAASTTFLPSHSSSRKPSVSPGILARRDSFIGLEGGEEDAISMVDSPMGTPGTRRTSVEQELLEATRRLEISQLRDNEAGGIDIQGASAAQAFNESISPRSKLASTSLPPLPTPGGPGALSQNDAWDWSSFIEAYRDGRWDPYKIPNPPEFFSSMDNRKSTPIAPVKLPHRPGSTSAPSSSSSITAPRTRTPPPTSSTRAPLLSNSTAAFQREAQPYFSNSTNFRVPTPRSPLSAPVALPSPSIASVSAPPLQRPTLKSTSSPSGSQLPSPQPKSKPFMANAEFAATVRLAGSSSNLAPFALPSPEHEHVDPLRAYASPGSNTSPSNASVNFSQPRKSKSGQMIGGSWTVSSGGLLPSQPTRLEVIPGTPASENAPSGTSGSGNGNGYSFPMATAPVERRKGSTDDASGEDYFGGAMGNWKPSPLPLPSSSNRRESLTTEDGPGSGDSTRTVVGRGVSYSGPIPSFASNGSYSPASTVHGAAGMVRTGSSADNSLNEFLTQPLTPGGNHFSSSNPPPLPSPLDFSSHSSGAGSVSASGSSSSGWNSNGPVYPPTPEETTFLKEGWLPAPLPANEKERLRALYRFDILHSGPDHNFDRISHLAKLVFSTKMVLISLVDQKDQWFKSESGFGCSSGSRASSFCGHVLLQKSDEPVVVLDALKDWRFEKNPLVVGPPHIRFYAGSPLRTSDGFNIGSLCVLDDKPRAEFSPRQRHALKEFAAIVMRELELWRDKLHLRRRGMIQDSMEKFTRDTVEMDVSALSVDQAMDKVYQQAAQLVQKTLDVDGALVLDLSSFELVETTSSDGLSTDFHYQADPYQLDGPTTNGDEGDGDDDQDTPGKENPPFLARASSFGPIPSIQVLGSSETVPTPESRSKLVSGVEHHKLAEWLKEFPDGKIYEKVVPSWFRHMLPSSGLAFVMLVPIFNIDRNPFALICAYTCEAQKEFLEGYELKYLRAIGLIILSAVLKRRLTLADKAKANFISNISHELRTPLHGILISSELLADTKLSTQQASYLETVQACGNSLIETVNHVLDFTKLSGNSSRTKGTASKSIETQEVDLVKLIEETVEGCWIGQRARVLLDDQSIGSFYSPASPSSPISSLFAPDNKTGIPTDLVECVIDVGLRKPGWKIKCEKGGIRRVLMNLIGNSLKFTRDGYVQIVLRELPSLPGSSLIPIELAVIDTGKGISREFLKDQLFQPFSQENPLQPGTGLGLAIVNSIVSSESVKGKVDVWSSEGLGTEIKVSFSAEPGREVTRGEPLSDAGVGYGLSVSLIGFFEEHRGLKLAQDVLETYLEDWGFDVRDETEPGWADILLINEDHSIIDAFTLQRNTSRPIILYASTRGSGPQSNSVASYVSNGGFAVILTKPTGPIKLEAAVKSAVNFINGGRRGSGSSSSGSSSRRGVTRSDSSHSMRARSRTPSEPGSFDHPSPSHSVSHSGPAAEITYFSPHNGSNGIIGSAAHQLSPTHYLQRRRSEEEREPRRRAKRPQMAPRSITYQPDTASPLAHEGYPLAHLTRRMSSHRHEEEEDEQPLTPSSPASVVSLADGGSVLRSATVLDEAEARSYGPKTATCLVVEDNPINRRVLAAFLQKKKFSFVEAVNGQEGVDVFNAHKENYFDVILCDLSMPILDGFGATHKIREIEKARRAASSSPALPPSRVTILALTGLATPEDKRRAFGSGVDGYLVKPVSLKTLDSVFKKLGFGL